MAVLADRAQDMGIVMIRAPRRGRSPLVVATSLLVVAGVAVPVTRSSAQPVRGVAESSAAAAPAAAGGGEDGVALSPADERGRFVYLIELAEPGLLRRVERVPGERLDPGTARARALRERLVAEQADHVLAMGRALGRELEVTHRFLVMHSGLAARLTPGEARIVRAMPGVVSVERERLYELATYRGPWFIGADTIWDGSAVPGGIGTRGEGIVVGVLDTGIDPEHPSFANDPSCGHGDGGAPDKLISFVDCSTTDGSGACNGLLPLDTNSHGTHVASTAAGNTLDSSADPPPEPFEEISGVAPCANIRMYKVCPDISCPGAMIQAGMDNVLLDGDVEVMNFSISGGRNPWSDNDRRKLDLVDAGVLVAAAAGNTGETITDPVGEVNHLGPWVLTVAASTHDGGDVDLPVLSASGPGEPPGNTQLLVMIKGSAEVGEVPDGEPFTDKPIRRAVDDELQLDDEGCLPFSPGYFAGAVALIQRGTCTFAHKITNAEAAGAEMVVLRNSEPGALANWNAGAPTVPAYSLSLAAGEALADWIGQHPDETTADFEFIPGQGQGDVLAGFSLRGPSPAPLQDLAKPDVTTPGVSIFAAEPGVPPLLPGGYGFKSGTSMASPHTAGAAALVRAVHPDWTVSELKSALMMSAFEGGTKEDETTPWDADDVGNGRVDLTRAARAGLVMDEIFDNYLAADPAAGGDVRTLNLPAVRDMDCTPSCSWTRTVRNTLDDPTSWSAAGVAITPGFDITVEPASFAFGGGLGETQVLTITAIPLTDHTAAVAFGNVVISEAGGLSPDLHVTVAIRGEPGEVEEPVLAFDPASLDFGAVEVGTTSAPQSAALANSGGADATMLAFGGLPDSGFEADTSACGETLPAGESCVVDVTFTPAEPGPAEATLVASSEEDASADLELAGQGVAAGAGFAPVALEVDPQVLLSDGNRLFEPGEQVTVAPAWRSDDVEAQSLQGTASAFTGPDGAVYTLVQDEADYGTVQPGQTASCLDTGSCYQMGVDDPFDRPARHWDATFQETLSDGTIKSWTLHIGDSFADVASTGAFYPFIETLLHHQVTSGCRVADYCPVASTTRAQMPVFVLRALEGAGFLPPDCQEGMEVFSDVPATSPFCPWIEELASRQVVVGCGGGAYCPTNPVTRAQMAVFALKTFEGGAFEPPACQDGAEMFGDVPASNSFCPWIEELARRDVVVGCGGGNYCPANPVTRGQMAVFISRTFGLTLYGP